MKAHIALHFKQEPDDLAGFARYLRAVGFPHRISEQGGQLYLWVYDENHIEKIQLLYELFQRGELAMPEPAARRVSVNRLAVLRYPLTLSLALLSVAGFLLVLFQFMPGLAWLSYQGFSVTAGQLVINDHAAFMAQLAEGQVWRLFSPMFLHFGLMHLAFNLTFLAYLGHQIERDRGALRFLFYVLFAALVSNAAQYLASPDTLFGGMSGVNYALLIYCVAGTRYKPSAYQCPEGLLWVSLVMMVLGFFQVFSLFGYNIANWAHLGGVISGLLLVVLDKPRGTARQ